MPGGSTTETQKTENQTTQPWAPAIPGLEGAIDKLTGFSTDVTPEQRAAMDNIRNSLTGLPNFSGAGGSLANTLFGWDNSANKGILTDANKTTQAALSPMLSAGFLNPMTTPGFSDALKTVNNDITNQINGQFVAAGRDLSPANSTALARGLSQGEGQLISNQFNTNVGNAMNAANSAFNAGAGTAAGANALDQSAVGNWLSGMGVAGQVPGLAMGPGMAQLGAASQAGQMPFQNLNWLTSGLLPIAALGGQGTSNTTGKVTQETSPWSNIIGGTTGALGLLGGTGAFGSAGWLAPALMAL